MSNLNVISIDMDYIMEPCINLYNDLCDLGNPEAVWRKINDIRNIDNHLSVNEENIIYVFDIFLKSLLKLGDKSKVMFAVNHDCILNELTQEKYKGCKFNITNIDHHHDISYGEGQTRDVELFNYVSIGNWVLYLNKYDLMNSYTWIKNWNSLDYKGKHLNNFTSFSTKQTFFVDVDSIDYIFVCNSPQWLPRKFDLYFNMLRDIYRNITGFNPEIIKAHYCEGTLPKPLTWR